MEVEATYGREIGVREIAERVYPHPSSLPETQKDVCIRRWNGLQPVTKNKTKPKSTWVTLPRYGGNEIYGRMAELADAADLGSAIERC